jgi:hypothetical protein
MNATSMVDQTIKELDHSSIIDVNKKIKTEVAIGGYDLSRQLPTSNKSWYFHKTNCFDTLVEITQQPSSFIFQKLGEFSLVIFIMGPWEYGEMYLCLTQSNGRRNIAYNHYIKSLIQQYQIKRYESNSPSWSHISYVDWGQVMGPKSFPIEKGIQGDIPHHFGLEARSCFIQMLVNHLKELEREEFHNLEPGWILLKSNDPADDCVHAGGSEKILLEF